jgi:hypothetical protein
VNAQVYVFPAIMMLAFGGYFVWMMNKRKQATAAAGPAMHAFFTRTGFRYAHLPPEPVDMHVQQAVTEASDYSARDRVTQYVRSFHGMQVRFEQAYVATPQGGSISGSWSTALTSPPRVPFHIADKSLSGLGKVASEMFSNTTRNWSPRFPQQVQTGIPQIDGRFVVFGFDPNAVRHILQQNPALVQALLGCAEVDLWVDQNSAVFADPMQKNMNAAMGGMVGNMALGFDIAKRMEMSIPVHERMSEILAMSVRAAA